MTTYQSAKVDGSGRGLNEWARPDDLAPGEAVVAKNVHFRNEMTCAQRRGYQRLLEGSSDTVKKGGPPAASIYVQGNPWWLEHEDLKLQYQNPQPNYVRQLHHAREGKIVIPAGDVDEDAGRSMSLDPKQSGKRTMIEFTLWTDDFPAFDQKRSSLETALKETIVARKGWRDPYGTSTGGLENEWAIVIKPVAASLEADPIFYVALRMWDEADGTATDFYYDTDGSTPSSFFAPGTRHWFAFEIRTVDGSAGAVHSYYWQDTGSAHAASTSNKAIPGGLGDGTGNISTNSLGCPVTIGGLDLHGSTSQGFNGVLGELRFYEGTGAGTGLSMPTFDADYAYYESEIYAADLAAFASSHTSLKLYYSFSWEQVTEGRFVLPRFIASGRTAAHNKAFLSGADASWVAATGALGAQALEFLPSDAQVYTDYGTPRTGPSFYRALFAYQPQALGDVEGTGSGNDTLGPGTHICGLRIPNAHQYMENDQATAARTYTWPRQMTVRLAFKTGKIDKEWGKGLAGDVGEARQVLWQWSRVRSDVGAGDTDDQEYGVTPIAEISIIADTSSGDHFLRFYHASNGGSAADIFGSGGSADLEDDTNYVAVATIAWGTSGTSSTTPHFAARLYENGTLRASKNSNSGGDGGVSHNRPNPSDNTQSTASGSNKNDEDGRESCYVMTLGCDATTNDLEGASNKLRMMYGAPAYVSTAADLATDSRVARRYWAFHTNDCPKTPNVGALYHGANAFRGAIGGLQIWNRVLSKDEVVKLSSREPTPQEIASYGPSLLSSWDFNEGTGAFAYDRGHNQNHIPIHPHPQCRSASEAVHRETKTPIEGFWEFRTNTPREGVKGREVLALAGGSVLRLAKDGSSKNYFNPIGVGLMHQRDTLPTAFQYLDYQYICTGIGPPIRVSRDRVAPAGISPPTGRIGNHSLGWQPADRDGTFQVTETGRSGGAGTEVFPANKQYIYAITFVDEDGEVESVPSRSVVHHVIDSNGADALTLTPLPKPIDKNITAYRIYRSDANGATLRFVEQIKVQPFYSDTTPDTKLGSILTSQFNLNPPHGISIGVPFGSRALYAGVEAAPSSLFFSRQGLPEAVPAKYRIDFTRGRSNEITGIAVVRDRAFVFFQDEAFLVVDNGTDIAEGSLDFFPLVTQRIKDSEGCISHHSIVSIDGVGLVFAGERGLYVMGEGGLFSYIGKRIESTWGGLDLTTARKWHAVHWRPRDEYILFCSTGGNIDRAIVWNYMKNSFSVYHDIPAAFSQVVEDETTGLNRLYFSDYLGQLWEFDSQTSPVNNDGAYHGTYTTVRGTMQGSSTTTRLQLAASGLPVAADGLRGTPVTVRGETRTILSNTATYADVDTAFSFTPASGDAWELGMIDSEWKSGKLDMGDHTRMKVWKFTELNTDANPGSQVTVEGKIDENIPDVYTEDVSDSYARVGPWYGRGRTMELRMHAKKADNPWGVVDFIHAWKPRGRAAWSR